MASTESDSMSSARSVRPPRHAAAMPSKVPGTAALTVPSTVAFSAMGAWACSVSRAVY